MKHLTPVAQCDLVSSDWLVLTRAGKVVKLRWKQAAEGSVPPN